MTNLLGKIVFITGANGGLGREMTLAFLKEGCHLILSDIHDSHDYPEPNQRILGYIKADISTEEGCRQLFSDCQKISPHIDILVNNAGIAVSGIFTSIPDPQWEKIFAVNLIAPIRLTKLFLPIMSERRFGHIVNISSVAGFLGAGELAIYSASKAGIALFGEAIKDDFYPKGINVTNVYPFFTRTPILDSPQFGVIKKRVVPNFLVCNPEDVIREVIVGIKRNKLSVYPGFISKFLSFSKRISPTLFLATMAFLKKLEKKNEMKSINSGKNL